VLHTISGAPNNTTVHFLRFLASTQVFTTPYSPCSLLTLVCFKVLYSILLNSFHLHRFHWGTSLSCNRSSARLPGNCCCDARTAKSNPEPDNWSYLSIHENVDGGNAQELHNATL